MRITGYALMKTALKQLSLRVDSNIEELRKLADSRGLSVTYVVRTAIDNGLTKTREQLKKLPTKRVNRLKIAAMIATTCALFFFGGQTRAATVDTQFVTNGRSMQPLFHKGDWVFCSPAQPSQLKVGDIIAYQAEWGYHEIVMHRITEIHGQHIFTKGDNNAHGDPGFTTPDHIKGVAQWAIASHKFVILSQ